MVFPSNVGINPSQVAFPQSTPLLNTKGKTSSNLFSRLFKKVRTIAERIFSSASKKNATPAVQFKHFFTQSRNAHISSKLITRQSLSNLNSTAIRKEYANSPSNSCCSGGQQSNPLAVNHSDDIKYLKVFDDTNTVISNAGFSYKLDLLNQITTHLSKKYNRSYSLLEITAILDKEVLHFFPTSHLDCYSFAFPFEGFQVVVKNAPSAPSLPPNIQQPPVPLPPPPVFDDLGFIVNQEHPQPPSPPEGANNISPATKNELHPRGMDKVVNETKKSLENRIQALEKNWDQEQVQTDFYNAFGSTDESIKNKILEGLKKMLNLVNNLSSQNFRMMSADEEKRMRDTLAYVHPNDKSHTISVHGTFFSRPFKFPADAYKREGKNTEISQTWILAHELSHFSDILDTDDQRYERGINVFKLAHHWGPLLYERTGKFNADNVAYYLEFSNMEKLKENNLTTTPGLDKYTVDFTEQAKQGKLEKISGRDGERKDVVNLLNRGSSPTLIGPSGVGKTAFVKDLALRIANGEIPELKGAEIRALDLKKLTGGPDAKYVGELSGRFDELLSDLKNATQEGRKVILFIDELHGIVGPGNSRGNSNGDFAHAIKEYLGNVEGKNDVLVIGATTENEYTQHIEKDGALARRFSTVKIHQPSPENATLMMADLAKKYAGKINVTDAAIKASVKYAKQYRPQGMLPSASGELLVDAINKAIPLANGVKPEALEKLETAVQDIKNELKNFSTKGASAEALVHYAKQKERLGKENTELDTLKARWEEQKKIVTDFKKATTQKTKEELKAALHKAHETQGVLAVIEVDERIIASVLRERSGIIIGQPTKNEARALLDLEKNLNAQIRGQGPAIKKFAGIVKAALVTAKKDDNGPLATLTLVGPPGTGKTKTVNAAAKLLGKNCVTLNMGNYNHPQAMQQLIATNGPLENIIHHPGSIVLLDEIHQAHPSVRDFLYSALSEGETTLNGRTYNFKNTIFVLNSNIGQNVINKVNPQAPQANSNQLVLDIKDAFRKAHFEDAFISRMGTFIPFMKLGDNAIDPIVEQQIAEFKAANQGIDIKFEPNAKTQLAMVFKENIKEGARALNSLFQSEVQSIIADEWLKLQEKNTSREDYTFAIDYNKDEAAFTVSLVKK